MFPARVGSRKPPRYSERAVSPAEYAYQHLRGARDDVGELSGEDEKGQDVDEEDLGMVSRQAATSQAMSATIQPPNTAFKATVQKPGYSLSETFSSNSLKAAASSISPHPQQVRRSVAVAQHHGHWGNGILGEELGAAEHND